MDNSTASRIGIRLKYFRERARMSQFELEIEIGASSGMISRIEQGKVNPTKETVLKIAEVTGMNDRELDYVIGVTAVPATQQEIDRAIEETKDYFSKKVIAYLIDERWRLCGISDYFLKILRLSKNYIENVKGTATIQFITDPKLKILDRFSEKHNTQMLDNNLRYYYKEVGFMNDDESFIKAVESIKRNEVARELWEKINYETDIKYTFRFGREVYFKAFGKIDIPFSYTYEDLLTNSRFKVVEYTPDNKFIKILNNIL